MLHQHFQHELVNEAIKKYTEVLLAGDEPEFEILSLLPPPPQFHVWEPDSAGRPRRWNKPWRRNQPEVDKQTTFTQPSLPDQEPILRMASTAEHPTESTTQSVQGATLLGYYWNLQTDCLSTNKNTKLNLYPARRGIRPSWGQISEAEDLLRLHKKKPLTQPQALAAAHTLFDPVQSAPFLAAALKYMYRYLIMTNSLENNTGSDYDKIMSEYFVREHLQPAVALAIATKRRLQQKRSWRLDPCVPYDSI